MENVRELQQKKKIRVAVIGAGASGLVAARHLSANPNMFETMVFEQDDQVGGTWVLSKHVGIDDKSRYVHSSMYNNLKTNLPKEIMRFPDFDFPDLSASYVGREDVLRYLEEYTDKFNLKPLIKFNHRVVAVRPLADDLWELEVTNNNDVLEKHHFEAVMICNGHYSDYEYPKLKGRESFRGNFIHSHDYREPGTFKDKRVLIIGGGPSAMDITMEVAEVAKQLVLSHHRKEPILSKFPENVLQVPDVEHLDEGAAYFKDGTSAPLDSIICCTGYLYSFPFLDPKCGITVDEDGVRPLFRHMFHIERPSMVFLALPNHVIPFPLADLQTRYFIGVLEGRVKLPLKAEMYELTKVDLAERRKAGLVGFRGAHRMGLRQRAYYDLLAKEAGVTPLPPVLSSIHAESHHCLVNDLYKYRKFRFKIIDDQTFEKF